MTHRKTTRGRCINQNDVFCYICGDYTFKENRTGVSEFVKRAYFGIKLGDQDKHWAPHIACKKCSEHLRQ